AGGVACAAVFLDCPDPSRLIFPPDQSLRRRRNLTPDYGKSADSAPEQPELGESMVDLPDKNKRNGSSHAILRGAVARTE
ncbi:MAG: hypothetical protein AAAB20_27535, partial [Rhizobium sp.]|uniref:hypothetical protein n=1 Tax=Rhizobium sp. TaxID=391 RepID=UPI0030F2155C